MKSVTTLPNYYENVWRNVLIASIVYEVFFIIGNWLNKSIVNFIGVGVFFLFLFIFVPNAFLKPDRRAVFTAIWPILAVLASVTLNLANIDFAVLIKYISFFVLYIIFCSCLPYPIAVSKHAKLFAFVVAFPIFLSFFFDAKVLQTDEVRLAGFFKNANNLALIAFLLPWATTKNRSLVLRGSIQGIVVITILASSTLGALLSYLFSFITYRYGLKTVILVLLPFAISTLVMSQILPDETFSVLDRFSPTHKILLQYRAISANFGSADINSPDYGKLRLEYGGEGLSGLWRLSHWAHILSMVANDGFFQLVFGHGAGSSMNLLPILPHNDHLRILFEQGLFGLSSFIAFFIFGVFYRVLPEHRYLVLAYLMYSFTENNMDNFLFMSLFAAMISASAKAFMLNYAKISDVGDIHRPMPYRTGL